VTINRPAADVFAYIADGTTGSAWRSSVVEIKHQSGEGVGAIYRQRVRGPLRRKIAADYEVTTYDPGRRLAFKAIAGPVRPTGTYRLSESNGRTKLTFKLDAEMGRLRRLLMGRSVQKSMNAEMKALDRLKELLEADAPAAAPTKPAAAKAAAKTAAKAPAAGATASKSAATSRTAKPATTKSAAAKAPATPRTARRRSKAS
jgi:hypothetical protein